jgi:hypothetical protein
MILGIFGPFQMIFIIIILGAIVVNVLYLLNLQDTMKEVHVERRLVPPANVWLLFIPLFNLVYPFILYPKICDSLKAEYAHRGLPEKGDFGKNVSLTMAILGPCGIIPYLGVLASIASFVLYIVYWAKMAECKNELRQNPGVPGAVNIGSNDDLLDN